MMNKKKIAAMMMAVSVTGTMAMSAFAEDAPVAPPENEIAAVPALSISITGDADGVDGMKTYQIKQKDDGSFVLVDEDGNESTFDFKFNAEGVDGEALVTTVSYSYHDGEEPDAKADMEKIEGLDLEKIEAAKLAAEELN